MNKRKVSYLKTWFNPPPGLDKDGFVELPLPAAPIPHGLAPVAIPAQLTPQQEQDRLLTPADNAHVLAEAGRKHKYEWAKTLNSVVAHGFNKLAKYLSDKYGK